MRLALALILSLLLSACGGGGGSSQSPVPQSEGAERPIHYGYYFGCSTYALEQTNKADLWWATTCGGAGTWATAIAQALLSAKTAGMECAVLHLKDGYAYNGGRSEVLRDLHELAALPTHPLDDWDCLAIYLVDEPDKKGFTDAQIREGNAAMRAGLADIPKLKDAPFAVFYACSTGQTPGFDTFKWVGCDDYQRRCAVTSAWDDYLKRMAPDQILMAISGGYGVTKQDPTCFKLWLSNQTRRIIMIGFTWQRTTEGEGIRDDASLKALYEALGIWALAD